MNKNDEWYTPPKIIERVRRVLDEIDTDPASSTIAQEWVRAKTYYTQETNGLDKPWLGAVFCNPPYSAVLLKKFTLKFAEEAKNGNMKEGIMLTNSGTDTLWNQNICGFNQVYTIGRISFLQPDGTEKGKGGRGQCFTYFGQNPETFFEEFCQDGFCWAPNVY